MIMVILEILLQELQIAVRKHYKKLILKIYVSCNSLDYKGYTLPLAMIKKNLEPTLTMMDLIRLGNK